MENHFGRVNAVSVDAVLSLVHLIRFFYGSVFHTKKLTAVPVDTMFNICLMKAANCSGLPVACVPPVVKIKAETKTGLRLTDLLVFFPVCSKTLASVGFSLAMCIRSSRIPGKGADGMNAPVKQVRGPRADLSKSVKSSAKFAGHMSLRP